RHLTGGKDRFSEIPRYGRPIERDPEPNARCVMRPGDVRAGSSGCGAIHRGAAAGSGRWRPDRTGGPAPRPRSAGCPESSPGAGTPQNAPFRFSTKAETRPSRGPKVAGCRAQLRIGFATLSAFQGRESGERVWKATSRDRTYSLRELAALPGGAVERSGQ